MVKAQLILAVMICCCTMACSQKRSGPGYQFELFKNTPNWDLAKAVEREDEKEIRELIKGRNININLQEPKFGVTLLHLAVGNDKLTSTRVLLEEGAKLNIADSGKNTPIHEATRFFIIKKNNLQILELLIKYGADVNDTLIKIKNNDTAYFYIPLMGATDNLACTKLLLNNGANAYVKGMGSYLIWDFITTDTLDESIYVAKYMIVDKKMLIPNPIDYSFPSHKPLDIFYYLNRENFRGDATKEKARQEILDYLKQIDFPNNGVYKENDISMKK